MKIEKDLKSEKSKYILSSNRVFIPVLFIVVSIVLECIQFKILGYDSSFPQVSLFNISVILIIAGIIYLSKYTPAMLSIFFVFIGLQIVINLVNANIFFIYGDLFTIDYLFLGDEGAAAFEWGFLDFNSIFIYIGILLLIITIVILLIKLNKWKIHLKKFTGIVFSLVFVLVIEFLGISFFAITLDSINQAREKLLEDNEIYVWDTLYLKNTAYETFGYYGFYFRNIQLSLSQNLSLSEDEKQELLKYIEDGKTTDDNLDNRLSNDNMIVILCESIDDFAIDPINTPFLWGLKNGEASYFSNFYAHNKTNVSESIAITGNSPKNNSYSSLIKINGYDYNYTLPALFEEKHTNAKTTYLHSWTENYYDRQFTYSNDGFGFDELYFIEDYLGENETLPQFGNWISEADFVEKFKEKIVPEGEEKFLTCYATVSSHGNYINRRESFNEYYPVYDANFNQFKEYFESVYGSELLSNDEFSNKLKNYKVASMDLDKAVEKIFKTLEEKGKLEDTTVVLYGDHNAYYHDFCYEVKSINKAEDSNIKINNVPLIIYNSKLDKNNQTQFCSTYDIFPTLCELHGLKYNKNLAFGNNLFTEEIKNSVFMSQLVDEAFNLKFYTNNFSDIEIIDSNYTQEEFDNFKILIKNFYNKQTKLDKIYMFNLTKDKEE